MESIFSHGRMEYIKGKKPEGCVFCKDSIRDESLILFENESVFVIMNKYPYNTGHLLVIPNRHIADLEDLTATERIAMFDALEKAVRVLKEVMSPEGFNVGINVGRAGGAGISEHLHLHIVPRWEGDTNFMTCLAETRVTPEELSVTCEKLKAHFEEVNRG